MSSLPELVLQARADRESHATTTERARREVAALYAERGGEFLSYSLSLARDEELARDAIQEAFMRYFIALSGGAVIAAPRPWLYRVMHNYLIDRMRQNRCEQDRSRQLVTPAGNMERECLHREILRLMRATLSAREYDCFRLRTEGLAYEEIATRLDLKSGTVGVLISRAIRKLRQVVSRKAGGAA